MIGLEDAAVVLFACGEPSRADDGVALAAVDRLSQQPMGAARVRRTAALWPEDLAGLAERSTPIVVDAVVGVAPGELVRIDLERLPSTLTVRPTSSHQLPLDMVIGLAKLLGWKPRGVFLGVGAERFDHGASLSPQVLRAVPELCAAIDREIVRARLATETAPAPADPR